MNIIAKISLQTPDGTVQPGETISWTMRKPKHLLRVALPNLPENQRRSKRLKPKPMSLMLIFWQSLMPLVYTRVLKTVFVKGWRMS